MAEGKFTDHQNEVLDGTYGGPQLTLPATIQFRLYTVSPSEGGGGTEVDVADWSNYAPVDITNNSTNFPAAVGGMKTNGIDIDFGIPTLLNPVTITAWASFDEATGDRKHFKELDVPVVVVNGKQVVMRAGDIVIFEG